MQFHGGKFSEKINPPHHFSAPFSGPFSGPVFGPVTSKLQVGWGRLAAPKMAPQKRPPERRGIAFVTGPDGLATVEFPMQ